MKRDTEVVVKKSNRAQQCHFSWKCKDRGDVIISMSERGRTPHDIHLCDAHAQKMISGLLGHYSMGSDLEGMINRANEIIKSSTALINAVMDTKDRKITFDVIKELLLAKGVSEDDLRGIKFKGTHEAIKMLLGYDTREFTDEEIEAIYVEERMEIEANDFEEEMEDYKPELTDEELDFVTDEEPGFTDEDSLLEAIEKAALEEEEGE